MGWFESEEIWGDRSDACDASHPHCINAKPSVQDIKGGKEYIIYRQCGNQMSQVSLPSQTLAPVLEISCDTSFPETSLPPSMSPPNPPAPHCGKCGLFIPDRINPQDGFGTCQKTGKGQFPAPRPRCQDFEAGGAIPERKTGITQVSPPTIMQKVEYPGPFCRDCSSFHPDPERGHLGLGTCEVKNHMIWTSVNSGCVEFRRRTP